MTASLGHSRAKMDEVKHEPGFPVQVAMLGRAAVYSRADFERWLRGEPLPVRKLNERQHEYLGSRDLAELLGAYRSARFTTRSDAVALTTSRLRSGRSARTGSGRARRCSAGDRSIPSPLSPCVTSGATPPSCYAARGHATTGEVAEVVGRTQQSALHRLKVWQVEGRVVRHGRAAGITAVTWALPPGDSPDNPAP